MVVKEFIKCLQETGKSNTLLISGLQDLDAMVEMDDVKQSIIDQIKFLLVNDNLDGHMLHTVLSGDPGVGKTQTGLILAKIWTALGLLQNRFGQGKNKVVTELHKEVTTKEITTKEITTKEITTKEMKDEITKELTEKIDRLESRISTIKIDLKNFQPELNLSIYNLKTLKRELSGRPEILFRSWTEKIEDVIDVNHLISAISDDIINSPDISPTFNSTLNPSFNPLNSNPLNSNSPLNPLNSNPLNSNSPLNPNASPLNPNASPFPSSSGNKTLSFDEIDQKLKDLRTIIQQRKKLVSKSAPSLTHTQEDLIKIVSREDFIGGYLGQSALKTEALLKECIGKVLFIDEAYSLVHDEKDSYGKEALTCLNRFMSEHPTEIIVIFAGYKELMDKTIFKYQPGLKRRCSWYFEIKGYTELGLSQIFKKQLKDKEWTLAPELDIEDFFKQHKEHFPAYGGDTSRLAFYCKIVYSTQVFDHNYPQDKEINQDILEQAFLKLKSHKIGGPKHKNYSHMFL